jgi:quercetin dioxygenase-like cupin family protein
MHPNFLTNFKKYHMRAASAISLISLCAAIAGQALAEEQPQLVRMADIKWNPCDPKTPSDPCVINYFRGDPEKEENHSYFKIPKGYTFSPHWHINEEHVIVTKGTLVVGGEKDSKGMTVRAGDYLHVPAKSIHWVTCASAPDCVVYLNVEGPDSYIDVKDRRP